MQRPFIRPYAYSILIMLSTIIITAVFTLLLLLFHYCLCYKTVATDNLSRASLFTGAAELTIHLLRLINILWLPLCRINKFGFYFPRRLLRSPILVGHQDYFLAPLPGSIALFISSPECDIALWNSFIMGRPGDKKFPIIPSTTRKGTILSTAAALDSPSVLSKLVTPPQASCTVTPAESEITCDDASNVLDDTGSLGPFLDATIAKSKQIENAEIPDENAETPVNSPEFTNNADDDLDELYVELNDDFIEECQATTGACNTKSFLEKHAVRYKLSPDAKFATSPINIKDKDYDFSLDLAHIAIVEREPFCGTEK